MASQLPVALVCAHSPVFHKFFEAALAGDFDVIETSTVQDSVERLEFTKVDLVIFDEKTAEDDSSLSIKTLRQNSEAPILVITSSLKKSYRRQLLTAGASDFIREPLERENAQNQIAKAKKNASIKGKVSNMKSFIPKMKTGIGKKITPTAVTDRAKNLMKETIKTSSTLGIVLIELDEYEENEGKWSRIDQLIPKECESVVPLGKNRRMLMFKNSSRDLIVQCADYIRKQTQFRVGHGYMTQRSEGSPRDNLDKVMAEAKENCR
jgi:DNA-binding NarL/FixJ family response regulator